MSNLDTTLREKFKKAFRLHLGTGNPVLVKNSGGTGHISSLDEVADFFLAEFHQLMNEKREAIEALKLPANSGSELVDGLHRNYNQTVDDVLSILKE